MGRDTEEASEPFEGQEDEDSHPVEDVMEHGRGEAEPELLGRMDLQEGEDAGGEAGADVGAEDDGDALVDGDGAGSHHGDNQGGGGGGGLDQGGAQDAHGQPQGGVGQVGGGQQVAVLCLGRGEEEEGDMEKKVGEEERRG